MSDITTLMMAASGVGGAEETDPNFNQTVLLLHGDGTDGAQNNTFLDSSTNNFTITRNGNTTQGTFSPFSAPDGRWSNYFDGTSDNITAPNNAAFDLSTDDFTISCWIYPVATGVYQAIVRYSNGIAQNSNFSFALSINSDNTIRFDNLSGNSQETVTGGAVAINTWSFITVTRSGSSATVYVNGSGTTDTVFATSNLPSGSLLRIGSDSDGSSSFYGYISNLRIVKGSATAPGSNPTAPLTAVSGTSLLTCQSNRFVDNSSNAFAITPAGNVKVTPFSPFAPTAAYSASVNGGSGYFDTTDDCLTGNVSLSSSTTMNTFTVEGWIYPTSFSSGLRVIGDLQIATPFFAVLWVEINTSGQVTLQWYDGASKSAISTGVMQANAWNWFAIVVNAGAISIYVNSTTAGQTGTTTLTNRTQTCNWTIGRFASQTKPAAYMSNLRWSNGVARTITEIPTAPYTSDSDVRLLCNFANGGILDNTGKNNLETVGNAQIDTTTKQFGTGSMEFDGTDDYLTAPDSQDWDFGTGDFTIEAWVNFNTVSVRQCIATTYQTTPSVIGFTLQLGDGTPANSDKLHFGWGDTTIAGSASLSWSTGTWYHLAVARSGTTLKLFRDGTEVASVTDSTSLSGTSGPLYVGILNAGAGGLIQDLNGYIDDLRITKGVARYTTTFTPPTKELPNL